MLGSAARSSYTRAMPSCPRCGEDNPDRARFCLACGAALSVATAREERKLVSVLFADVVGFTGRAEQLDPEDVRAFQDPYWGRLRAELERHGGTVEKYIGDAVVGLFGAPLAHEDDPERAVRAALAIRDWAREQERLQVRIGLTTGETLVRLGAQPLAGEGMASGDVMNTVSRVQAAAPANGILVDETTYRATRHAVDYRQSQAAEAKGKAQPLLVWEAVQARSRLGVDIAHHARAPLVGRERELDALRAALARARDESTPQLVTLVGVPGIGKSRLVYELGRSLEAEPELVRWRQGRSLPYGDGAAFWALAEIVKSEAAILETDDAEEAAAKLAHAVQVTVPDEAGWVERHLRPLVGLAGSGTGDAGAEREAFAAWRRFLEALAEERPTVLVFEDLHWAHDGLLDFIDHFLEWAARVPVLVICTARPEVLERRPGWGGGQLNAAMLALSPLNEEQTETILEALLDGAPPDTQRPALLERVAGNPLYAEQFATLIGERGSTDRLPLPETLYGVIAARLDALPQIEKSLLQNAAVFGKVFWEGAALALDGVEREAAAAHLHALERKAFVQRARRSSVAGDAEYAFSHVLVRDVAYGQIPRTARADKHERAAAWLEALGRAEDHADMLAHHYVSALDLRRATGRPDDVLVARTVRSLIRAGERASAVNAFASAATHFERTLQLLPVDDAERPQLLFDYARALNGAGDDRRADALEQARVALLAAGDVESAAEADALLSVLAWYQGRRRAADEHLQRARTLVQRRAPSAAKAQVVSILARRLMQTEDERAIDAAQEALGLAETLDLPELQAQALITLGTARWTGGDPAGSSDIERGLQLALEHGALSAAERGYNNLALTAGRGGDLARRVDLLHEAERLSRRLGDRDALRFVRAQLISQHFAQGRWDEALREADDFVAECESGSPNVQEASVRRIRAEMRLARDDVSGALADQERSLALARDFNEPEESLAELTAAIRLYATLGRLAEARRMVDEVRSYDPAVAAKYILSTLAWWRRELRVSDAELASYLALIPAHLSNRDVSELLVAEDFERAADVLAGQAALSWEAATRKRAAEQLLERGRHDEAGEQLARALEFYRSVNATRYIREAQALLETARVGLAANEARTAPDRRAQP